MDGAVEIGSNPIRPLGKECAMEEKDMDKFCEESLLATQGCMFAIFLSMVMAIMACVLLTLILGR